MFVTRPLVHVLLDTLLTLKKTFFNKNQFILHTSEGFIYRIKYKLRNYLFLFFHGIAVLSNLK